VGERACMPLFGAIFITSAMVQLECIFGDERSG
jgi:hypothetical protein